MPAKATLRAVSRWHCGRQLVCDVHEDSGNKVFLGREVVVHRGVVDADVRRHNSKTKAFEPALGDAADRRLN